MQHRDDEPHPGDLPGPQKPAGYLARRAKLGQPTTAPPGLLRGSLLLQPGHSCTSASPVGSQVETCSSGSGRLLELIWADGGSSGSLIEYRFPRSRPGRHAAAPSGGAPATSRWHPGSPHTHRVSNDSLDSFPRLGRPEGERASSRRSPRWRRPGNAPRGAWAPDRHSGSDGRPRGDGAPTGACRCKVPIGQIPPNPLGGCLPTRVARPRRPGHP